MSASSELSVHGRMVVREGSLQALQKLASEKGYSAQWAAHVFQQREARLGRRCLCGARQQPDGSLPCGH